MRNAYKYILFLLLAAFVLSSTSAYAGGGNRQGSAGADQLLVPVGARGIALGSSFLAGISGVEAIYYNPAGLSASTASVEAMFSQMTWFDNDGVSYLAVGSNFAGFGHIALTIKAFSFGDILLTDERNPDGGKGTFSPAFATIGLTYSRALTDRIRAGVSGYLVTETLNRASATGAAFDIGVQYNGLAGLPGLGLGVTLRHLGGNMKYDGPGLYRNVDEIGSDREGQLLKIEAAGFQLPTSLEIGVAYTHSFEGMHSVTAMSSFENNNFLYDQIRIGMEYMFRDMFFVRGSYSFASDPSKDKFDTGDQDYLFGPSFGAGVKQDLVGMQLSFDYAYRTTNIFKGTHVFSLGVSL